LTISLKCGTIVTEKKGGTNKMLGLEILAIVVALAIIGYCGAIVIGR
jgi:hypothetical protein